MIKDLNNSETENTISLKKKSLGLRLRALFSPNGFSKMQTFNNHLSNLRFEIIKFCLNILF